MPITCGLSKDKIQLILKDNVLKFRIHNSKDTLKKDLKDVFNTLAEGNLDNVEELVSTILNSRYIQSIKDVDPDFFSKDAITTYITGKNMGIIEDSKLETSGDKLTEPELVHLRENANLSFLTKMYGLATGVKDAAVIQMETYLFDSCFINRGSINGIITPKDNIDLTRNIYLLLDYLLSKVTDYLNYTLGKSKIALKDIPENVMLILLNPKMYENEQYTNALEILKPYLDNYLTFNTSDDLISLYNEKSKESNLKLQAYNAKVFLTHFDTYLSVSLKQAINIKGTLNNHTYDRNKYDYAKKSSKISTTWNENEDYVNVEEYSDVITKMAINTTKYYRWNSNTETGRFLNFGQFSHIIGKIKDLVYIPELYNIRFDDNYIRRNRFFNTLSPKTKKILKDKSLAYCINSSRKSARDIFPAIFELLSNNEFKKTTSFMDKTNFTDDELNILYSLSRSIFNPSFTGSLYNLSNTKDFDIFSYITHIADSIYNVNYIQYHKNTKGITTIRTLKDLTLWVIGKNIENNINTINSIKQYNKVLNNSLVSDVVPTVENDILKSLEFTILNTRVVVNAQSGTVIFKNVDSFLTLWKLKETIKFLDSIFGLNLTNDPDFVNELVKSFGSLSDTCENLLSFACRVLLNLYVSFNYIKDLRKSVDIKEKLNEIYKDPPNYNYGLGEMELISKYDIPKIKNITEIKANLLGVTTASLVKDSQGNALGLQTTSRLLGSLHTQFDLQEFTEGSASELSLLRIPGLLELIFTSKELYDEIEGSNVSSVDMNVKEMCYSSFVYDFISGLLPTDSNNSFIGNNHVLFVPSVNSDKNTASKAKFNLNIELGIKDGVFRYNFTEAERREFIQEGGILKSIVSLNSQERKALIALRMGDFYSRSLTNILNTYGILDNFLKDKGFSQFKSDYLNNFNGFINWWISNSHIENGKRIGNTYGEKSPIDFIKKSVLEYNKLHRNNPIEFVDLLAFREGKLKLDNNEEIKVPILQKAYIALVVRFNPNFISQLNPNFNFDGYYDQNAFWKLNNIETLLTLLKNEVSISTINSDLAELVYLSNYKQWINTSGNVIFAKVTINEKTYNISSNLDVLKLLRLLEVNSNQEVFDAIFNNFKFELHPLINKYCDLNYLLTLEFMNCTVGTFAAHPEKSKSDKIIELEAACFLALDKRNVSFTASVYEFQLNLLNGSPEDYNIAVIEDIKDELSTIMGLNYSLKPFDGSTYVNPFVVILENNSLGPDKAGVIKKPFIHFKNEKFGNGGIIKTAGFGLTNDWIRNSPFLDLMMRKMTNHRWFDLKGNVMNIDITRNYENKKIVYQDRYFTKNGKVYQIEDINVITLIDPLTNQPYYRYVPDVYELSLNLDGKSEGKLVRKLEIDEIIDLFDKLQFSDGGFAVNSDYELWHLFGGQNSMAKKGKYLEFSNTSVENVVIAMNSIGVRISDDKIETLLQLYQPLKHSDIHYVATAGAVKQGAANINSVDKYTNDEDYDFQKVHMYQAGILLDKEHHADDSDLSLMTLVISACALNGYTFEASLGIYSALKLATELGIKEHLNALLDFLNTKDLKMIQEVLMETIIRALSTSNSENFATKVANEFIEKVRSEENIKFSELMLPLSDNTIYSKIFSIINAYLTNSGIKQKIPGILSVLTPSYDIMKLYPDGKGGLVKYEAFTNPELELEEIQANTAPIYEVVDGIPVGNISDIELNRTYLITEQVPKFANFVIGGTNIEKGWLKVIWDRIYNIAPSNIKGLITKIINGNSNLSLRNIFDKIINTISDPEKLKVFKDLLLKTINAPIDKSESLLIFNEINPEIILAIITNNRDTIYNELSKYKLQEYTDLIILDAKKYPIQIETKVTSRLIRTGDDYRRLKTDVQSGKVIKVVENVKAGRNLKTYNVRFGTTDGLSFQIHDLDSQTAISEFNRISNIKDATKKAIEFRLLADKYFPNKSIHSQNELFNNIKKWIQRDLMNLSKSTPDIMLTYDELLKSLETWQSTDLNSLDINTISNSTESFGVQITNGSKDFWNKVNDWLKNNPAGIVAYRKYGDKPATFSATVVDQGWIGNPFSVTARGSNTVQQFYDWLVTGNDFGEPRATEEYRLAIINKILSTPQGSPILYYTELNRPSHATVIGYLIEHKELLQLSTINPNDDPENFNTLSESAEILSSDKTILSNEELKYWNELGVGEMPRIISASERTDPAFHVKEILDVIEGKKTIPQWGIVNGKRQVIGNLSGKDFAGLYIITKHDGLPMLLLLQTKIPKLIHFSITGLGGTIYEPGVMKYNDLLDKIEDYIKLGLDPNSVTIRIDPIVPGVTKKEDIENIVHRASLMGIKRIRFSIMDAYDNTVAALNKTKYDFEKYYGSNNGKINFNAKSEYIDDIVNFMLNLKDKYKVTLGTCAENIARRGISKEGCLSVNMVNLMLGTTIEDKGTENNTLRKLCSCYGGKVDCLAYNKTCASHCIYCYAKHENDKVLEYYNEDGTLKDNIYTRTREISNQKLKSSNWYNHYARIANIILETGHGNKIEVNGLLIEVNKDNFLQIEQIVRDRIQSTTNVRINGLALRVDRNTLKTDPYGLIMTKTFATAFGLKEFDSVQAIKNDPDFFIKQYIDNNATLVNPDLFAIELKRTTGNHLYLLTKRLAVNAKGLYPVDDSTISKAYIDGVRYRLDEKGNILYLINDDFKLYRTSDGVEVIVTDNLNFYVLNLKYSGINLSDDLAKRPALLKNIVSGFKNSNKKIVLRFYRKIRSKNTFKILELNKKYNSPITRDNLELVKLENPNHPILRMGRTKWVSFLKSLQVVAARIPSQSMQSFMPMEVLAFDNPDINTAFVATMQLLLLGSKIQ